SPDGTKILFNSDRTGEYDVYVMNADGSEVINLTKNSAGDWNGVWSADGRSILFTSDRDGKDQLYIMNADGSGQTRLVGSSSNDSSGDW
ncbi:MAG: hypothetical protein L0Z70_16355, partial [Chloroflexi bacterium]|nr:hypothetical protein [Chloroflexota bacterium]